MGQRGRLLIVFSGTIVAVLLSIGYVAAVMPEQKSDVKDQKKDQKKVVFPPNKVVLLSGTFDVISTVDHASFEIDGRSRSWEPFGPSVHVAHVGLSPGFHELKVGDRLVEFVVALNEEDHDGPSGWPHFRRHTMNTKADRCNDCHKTSAQDNRTVVGEVKGYKACFVCHESVEFELIHSHPLEPLEPCQMCHSLHGSSRKSLLRAPAKKLCDKCHES